MYLVTFVPVCTSCAYLYLCAGLLGLVKAVALEAPGTCDAASVHGLDARRQPNGIALLAGRQGQQTVATAGHLASCPVLLRLPTALEPAGLRHSTCTSTGAC